jgi:Dam-replacing family
MMDAIRRDELPSMYFMQYEIRSSRCESAQTSAPEFQMEPTDVGCHGSRGEGMLWFVRNLLLVPHFAFPPSAIIKRKPLSSTARRHGWVAFFHP